MAKDSTQQKLSRVRAPKVHITFDQHTDGATKKVELPFVVGVMSDLSNKAIVDEDGDAIPVKERKFKEIDRDNFGQYMATLAPEANVRVDNKLDDSGGKVGAKLTFKSMDDFRPERVAEQVPALKALLDMRKQLADCKSKIDGNEKLERDLQSIIEKTLEKVGGGGDAPSGDGGGDGGGE